jgi:nucleotide-binding universal stress UspA family protein
MERILVSMESGRGAWEALSRTVSLARRIQAKVYALVVLPPAKGAPPGAAPPGLGKDFKERLELLIGAAKAQGVDITYYVAEGVYESQVISFAKQQRITLLVAEQPDGEGRGPDREPPAIQKIRHLIDCPVELVSPRSIHEPKPEES